ncbi:MAG TPA: ornithine cyclodeaminase family protein [Candidatus Dormibacteraeota bacterium]|nr:ornithine cyclodeaminase family protein [Candidatus Dormibacteraeota bacterium]
MLVLSRHEVEKLLAAPPMLDALEAGFRAYSTGQASVPPRTAARAALGLLGAMPGWVAEQGFALKAVSVFPGNGALGLPTHQGVITLFDERDGSLLSVMDGEHITAMRTGGGAAVSVRILARSDAQTLTILGAGVQGHSHLATVPLVRDFTTIRICSRDRASAAALAATDPRCVVVPGFEEAVRGADVVCCCTDAREPITRYDWIDPGTHLTSVGGTFGPEVDADTIRHARVFVEWRGAAENAPPAGAHELQGRDPGTIAEVGEVIAGLRPGRQSQDEITVYKSTGIGFEDAVVARIVYDAAVAAGVGTEVAL